MDRENGEVDNLFNLEWERPVRYPTSYYLHCSKWNNVAKKRIVTEFPIQLTIETNTTCNLHCKMCMRRQLHLRAEYLKYSQFTKYLNEAIQYKDFESIKPNYRNEPTMHPELAKMFNYARQVGVKEIIMNTNGKFRPEVVSKLAPYVTEVAFSLDATTNEVHNRVRPGGDLKAIERNVLRFIEKRNTYRNLRVRVAFVVQKENMHQRDDFVRKWKNYNVDKIVVNQCFNPQQKGENRATIKWRQKKKFVCPQLYQRLVITTTGEVLPCCGAYDESISLGNIIREKKSIYEYWRGEKMNNLRNLHENGSFKDIPTCSRCALSYEVVK